jgi:hypothetical protein
LDDYVNARAYNARASLYNEEMKEFRKEKRALDKHKTSLWAMIKSTLSDESYNLCCSHTEWHQAMDPISGDQDPAMFIKVIIDSHRNGILDDNVSLTELMYGFKCSVLSVKQMTGVTLFQFYRLVSNLKKRDKNICTLANARRRKRNHIDYVLTDSDYIQSFLHGLNGEYKTAIDEYSRDVRFGEREEFDSLEDAHSYIRTWESVKSRDKSSSAEDLQVYKTAVEKIVAGDPDSVQAFLTSFKTKRNANGRKSKGAKKKGNDKKANQPSRPCKHCGELPFISDSMHWDKDCPLKAYTRANSEKDNDKPRPKKRKARERDDHEEVHEDDDDDDDGESKTYVVEKRRSKKSKG